ncbi:acyl-CoA thioesterase [Brevundimonas sp. SORGH_AS_0993]|uniref:acyl-CoA thioesterase n=1 Tax=Brevundimonas sp. SORGH_AS_0993 TaxID=3041794 RepID=UPI00278523D8|nr:acyl-CoA thioesterase [Brevundimonas sp. SORGH_AS_0993]MDQ1154181.1 acyl-CoA hydrolase [Brevundimonas sp. SORGH_AS_0993]
MISRLIDMVFPGDANHHGTLFGGVGLAHLDKVAFLAASRHARRTVVTAGCERIDFAAPARIGEMVEAVGRVVRTGRSSLGVEVELHAEALLTGERRLCTRGLFHMVASRKAGDDRPLEPLDQTETADDGWLRTAEMVFPGTTNHYGGLFGGDALKLMGKAAFVTATRHSREVMVMAATNRIDFKAPVDGGDMVELVSRVKRVGRSSLSVEVQLWAERLLTGERRLSATAEFTMVAVDGSGRPKPFAVVQDVASGPPSARL